MKIRAKEIYAAKDADSRLSSDDAEVIIRAVLAVRKARKAAKRERQRKEKDKQVVESVSINTNMMPPNYTVGELKAALAGVKPAATGKLSDAQSYKAHNWDGTYSLVELLFSKPTEGERS